MLMKVGMKGVNLRTILPKIDFSNFRAATMSGNKDNSKH